jgi:DNA-binding transcriptional LysR family regulator
VSWVLDGHGILMRADWDVASCLRNGRLVQVLPQYHSPDADIYARLVRAQAADESATFLQDPKLNALLVHLRELSAG